MRLKRSTWYCGSKLQHVNKIYLAWIGLWGIRFVCWLVGRLATNNQTRKLSSSFYAFSQNFRSSISVRFLFLCVACSPTRLRHKTFFSGGPALKQQCDRTGLLGLVRVSVLRTSNSLALFWQKPGKESKNEKDRAFAGRWVFQPATPAYTVDGETQDWTIAAPF